MAHPPSSNNSANVQVGPGLFGLCTFASIVLAILKLIGIIGISWLAVFLPMIIGAGVTLILVIFAIILFVIAASVSK